MDLILLLASLFAGLCSLNSLLGAIVFSARLRDASRLSEAEVAVILPATGALPGLEELLDRLARQVLRPRRVIIAVESRRDPAYGRVCSQRQRPDGLAIDIVVAGLAERSGQKCVNLLAAIEALTPADAYGVLIDADIRPQPWFLSGLVGPLAVGDADIVNGYRWLAPVRDGIAATLIAALDRRNSVLPRLRNTKLLWGGCIAMSRRALAALDLPAILDGQISDDLSIGERAVECGLRVLPLRGMLAPTPLDGDFSDLFAFARRQLQMVRLYRPGLWSYALFVATGETAARLWLVAEAVTGAAAIPALLVLIAIAAMDVSSARLRLTIGERIGVKDSPAARALHVAFALSLFALPISMTVLLWLNIVARRIRWAHVCYDVDGSGRVLRLERKDWSSAKVAESHPRRT